MFHVLSFMALWWIPPVSYGNTLAVSEAPAGFTIRMSSECSITVRILGMRLPYVISLRIINSFLQQQRSYLTGLQGFVVNYRQAFAFANSV